MAEQQRRQHVFDLPNSNRFDVFLFRSPFDTVIVAEVVIVSVSISFAVSIIVLVFKAHQVVHGKAVMRRDEVDTAIGCSPRLFVEVRRSAESRRHSADHSGIASPIPPNVIAVSTVPLRPTQISKRTDLIGTRSIPSFRNDLGVGQHRILGDQIDQGRVRHQVSIAISRQDTGKIESETIDVIVVYPMAQAMKYELPANRVIAIERIAAASVVAVMCAA